MRCVQIGHRAMLKRKLGFVSCIQWQNACVFHHVCRGSLGGAEPPPRDKCENSYGSRVSKGECVRVLPCVYGDGLGSVEPPQGQW